MHIVDGALSGPVLAAGGAVTLAGTAWGLRSIGEREIPRVGLLSAAFFMASLIHVPVGPSSVHLILNGLIGLVLGWRAFPALLVALLLQAVFFGFGGVVVLGVNVANIALPAVLIHFLLRDALGRFRGRTAVFAMGLLAGAGSIMGTTLLVAASLAGSGQEFLPAAELVFFTHIPVMVVEGLLTGAALVLIRRVRPELLHRVAEAAPLAEPAPALAAEGRS
ncbi:MAG: cobalt transporter CbiM [Magnetococcales bacterium]|nr:cobalt transporter CbiM [Magnetococcales bacterium]